MGMGMGMGMGSGRGCSGRKGGGAGGAGQQGGGFRERCGYILWLSGCPVVRPSLTHRSPDDCHT